MKPMRWLLSALGRRFGMLLPQLIGLGLFAYFAFHFVEGERGVRAYAKLGQDLKAAWTEEASLRQDLADARARVAFLSVNGLDLDLLEERAQAVLNYARPEEVVVILPDGESGGWQYEGN